MLIIWDIDIEQSFTKSPSFSIVKVLIYLLLFITFPDLYQWLQIFDVIAVLHIPA